MAIAREPKRPRLTLETARNGVVVLPEPPDNPKPADLLLFTERVDFLAYMADWFDNHFLSSDESNA